MADATAKKSVDQRKGVNRLSSQITQCLEEAKEQAERIASEYKDASRELADTEREDERFIPIPWPDVKSAASGAVLVYWRRMEARKVQVAGKKFRSKHIPVKTRKDPYPEKYLSQYTDELNHDLVMNTERALRSIARMTDHLVRARQENRQRAQGGESE